MGFNKSICYLSLSYTYCPSWDTHTDLTERVCPLSTVLQCPVLASQTRTGMTLIWSIFNAEKIRFLMKLRLLEIELSGRGS
jgi:hypothetical protein